MCAVQLFVDANPSHIAHSLLHGPLCAGAGKNLQLALARLLMPAYICADATFNTRWTDLVPKTEDFCVMALAFSQIKLLNA